ncbi:MAG TPA: PrgI family protein [Candidatus Paceibacterota bacterium]
MQFQVPQFIEIEDKIIGPLTFRQFAYVAGAGGVVVIFYTLLPFFLMIILGAPVVIFALALAFYKVNNRPFIYTLEAAFHYALSRKLYLWKHEQKVLPKKATGEKEKSLLTVPQLSQNKLKDIAWSLDIQESMYSRKDQR